MLQRHLKRLLVTTSALVAGACFSPAQTPDANDLVWQKAVQKFHNQRQRILKQVDQEANAGPFKPTWESLTKYQTPEWYQDAKFGIFLHWGLYAVPAFDTEWYPRNMYLLGNKDFAHHVKTFGAQKQFGYKDFAPRFKAEKFDANAWVDLFRRSGAKFVVPVAEHHDGFAMYDSDLSDWTAKKVGPQRDIVGDLAAALRANDLHVGASSHRAEHYFFLNGGRAFPSDVQNPKYADFYGPAHVGPTDKNKWAAHPDHAYLEDWLARTAEIIIKYRPEVLWFDWWINTKEFEPYLKRLASFYYNDAAKNGYPPAINYKFKAYPDGAAVLDIERGQLENGRKLLWQTDTSISVKSWGYIEGDTFRSPESLIQQLVDIVSKNGCLLLNVGPKPDGTIPEQAQQILLDLGRWLNANGESVYGTRPWAVYGEGPTKVKGGSFNDTANKGYTALDIRFTSKGDTLYATALGWPNSGKLTIKSLAQGGANASFAVGSVKLLGSDSNIQFSRDSSGLHLLLPSKTGEYAYVFKISK